MVLVFHETYCFRNIRFIKGTKVCIFPFHYLNLIYSFHDILRFMNYSELDTRDLKPLYPTIEGMKFLTSNMISREM